VPEASSFLWSQPPKMLTFPSSRVELWKVHLNEPPKGSEAGVLSADEIARANRFHFEKDRLHFIHCRASLRSLLARYLTIPPNEIQFEYTANGKPELAAKQNPSELRFNVSHSADIALIAISSKHNLGVDIEKIRSDVDTTALAERFFSVRERAGLRALPSDLRVAGFYACWTRKEAFLKATGEGLSFPLAQFSVTTHPDLDPHLEEIRGNTDVHQQWFLADITLPRAIARRSPSRAPFPFGNLHLRQR
jgi:4'-phosphopantetheinyl transferase